MNEQKIDISYSGNILEFSNSKMYDVAIARLFRKILTDVIGGDKNIKFDIISTCINNYISKTMRPIDKRTNVYKKAFQDINLIISDKTMSLSDFYMVINDILHIECVVPLSHTFVSEDDLYKFGLDLRYKDVVYNSYLKIKIKGNKMVTVDYCRYFT